MPKQASQRQIILILGVMFTTCLSCGCASDEPPLSNSTKTYLEAKELIAKGQKEEALIALDASIKESPTLWSLRDRAKLHAERGEDKAAREDCEAALTVTPDDLDVFWIKGELAKPKEQRFQGQFKNPPSSNR
ncbi:MAG: hypothetical protein H0T51_18085 [Pirellulales bacterium]|nr:hypothetical protein [Pirellulales bacterium]